MINWDRVGLALESHKNGDSDTGAVLLLSAINGSSTPAEPPQPVRNVDWGKAGFTGVDDPRATSADHHGPNAIHLIVHERPDRPYRCANVEAYGPTHIKGGGRTVAYVNQPDGKSVVLATGYHGVAGEYDSKILHAPGQEIVVTAKFNPPNNGGLAIFLTDDAGNIISDEVGNLGLPGGQHFSFSLTFAKR